MLYRATITIPRNTLKTDPLIERVKVYPGITQRVWVGFPPGCAGLVGVQIWHKGWSVWPTTPGEWFTWDGYVFSFEDRYPVVSEPLTFIVKAYNEDDTFDHTVFFMVTIPHTSPEQESLDLMATLEGYGLLGMQGG
jgi:hypothetical protein